MYTVYMYVSMYRQIYLLLYTLENTELSESVCSCLEASSGRHQTQLPHRTATPVLVKQT